MNQNTNKKNLEVSKSVTASQVPEVNGQLSEQHITSIPILGVGGMRTSTQELFIYSFHWTVRFRVIEMTKKKAAILLKILVFEMLNQGLDFTGYIAVEFLVSYIMAGKTDFLEIYDTKDRQAVMLGILILSEIKKDWMSLDERTKFSPDVFQLILTTGWLPDKRTYQSWKQFYNVRSFIEIHTVPLEDYDKRSTGTERYSSYTKGYGNGGHVSRIQKTRYTSDLDGVDTEKDPPEYSLLELDHFNDILLRIERNKLMRQKE